MSVLINVMLTVWDLVTLTLGEDVVNNVPAVFNLTKKERDTKNWCLFPTIAKTKAKKIPFK